MATAVQYDVAGGSGSTFRIYAYIASQNIATNQSTINWELHLYCYNGTSWTGTPIGWSVAINGVGWAGSYTFDFRGPTDKFIAAASTTVTHNADGTLTIPIAGHTDATGTVIGGPLDTWGPFTLTTIPRATTPTVSPTSGPTGSMYTINHVPATSSFYHDVAYSLDGGANYTNIATNVAGTTTTTSWTPAHTLLPNDASKTAIIRVITRNSSGGTIIGTNTVNLPLTVPANIKPTISAVTWADTQTSGPDMPTLMGGAGRFVQRWSKLRPTVTSAGAGGSSISSVTVTQNGQTTASGVAFGLPISLSGAVPFSAIASDSRSRDSDPFTDTVAVTAYNFPNLPTPLVARTSDAGGTTPSPVGTYLAITPMASVSSLLFGGVQKNLLEWRVRTRPSGGSWTTVQDWTSATVSGTTWTTKYVAGGGYLASNEYEVEVSIRDLFGKNGFNAGSTVVSLTIPVPSERVEFDWDRNLGIGIGGYRRDPFLLDVHGKIGQDGLEVIDTDSLAAALAALTASLAPAVGSILEGRWSTAPTGYLMENGAAVSRTTYAPLYAFCNPLVGTVTMSTSGSVLTRTAHGLREGEMVFLDTTGALLTGLTPRTVAYYVKYLTANTFQLSTTRVAVSGAGGTAITLTGTQSGVHSIYRTYGVGNGTTTFNVPNSMGRVTRMIDPAQVAFNAIGGQGGENTHVQTLAELAAHTHAYSTNNTNAVQSEAGGTGMDNRGVNNAATSSTGSSSPMNVSDPYDVINRAIKF